jgi:hypothetical protein
LLGYASQALLPRGLLRVPNLSDGLAAGQSKPAAAGYSTKIELFMGSNDNEFVKSFTGSPADF